jgi:selenocysteine lyase/cysteine desulfurase
MLVNSAVELRVTSSVTGPAWAELEDSLKAALETYANVHRGAGYHSLATTHLFEQARRIVHRYLGMQAGDPVIFCSPHTAALLVARLSPDGYSMISSRDLGLPLGICAVGLRRQALSALKAPLTGGGTVRLVSPGWAIWEGAPERFEAGTPNITGAIALARALQLVDKYGAHAFDPIPGRELTPGQILYQDKLDHLGGAALLDRLRQESRQAAPLPSGARFLNLDHAASTPALPPVWDAFRTVLNQPETVQKEVVSSVRRICLDFLHAPADEYELIFSGNTTEAINLLAHSLAGENSDGTVPVVVNTLLEHNSNELPWRAVPGVRMVRLGVDEEGFLDLAQLDALLKAYNCECRHGAQRVRLLSISGASNVLGTCNDLASICRIAHAYGVAVLVDAAQLIAHRRIQMQSDGIDYLVFSAHKAYAPFGSGALVARRGLLAFSPAEFGALHKSGEENAAGIAALGKALILMDRIGMDLIEAEERRLTRLALAGMAGLSSVQIYGVRDPDSARLERRIGVIAFACDRTPHNKAGLELAQEGGIGVRTGCFCAHLLVKRLLRIHPLRARLADLFILLLPGFTAGVLPGLVRVSLGLENDENDVDRLLAALRRMTTFRRSLVDRFLGWSRNGTPFCAESLEMKGFAAMVEARVFGEG